MAKHIIEELFEAFKEMTLVELIEFKKALEEEFDVITAAPVAIAAIDAAGDDAAAEEKDKFDVILKDAGAEKIGTTKAVREIVFNLGLKKAKEIVESAPKAILEDAPEGDAKTTRTKLEEAGAEVSLK